MKETREERAKRLIGEMLQEEKELELKLARKLVDRMAELDCMHAYTTYRGETRVDITCETGNEKPADGIVCDVCLAKRSLEARND